MKKVELFYDVASAYARFAFEILCRYKSHWDIELKLRPFYMIGVLKGSGNTVPPISSKGSYVKVDIQRTAQYIGLTHKRPANFREMAVVKGTLRPQRFLTAVDMLTPQYTEQLTREIWNRVYVEDVDVTEPASLTEAALKAGMLEGEAEKAVTHMNDDNVKDRLRAATQEALDLGCFGTPFIVAHVNGKKEVFFGADRFPFLAMVIGETWKGPIPNASSQL